jgi:hypothetical protein
MFIKMMAQYRHTYTLNTLNANIVEQPNHLEIFGRKKTKEPKHDSQNRLRSTIPEGRAL